VDTLINPEAEPSPPITNEVPKSVRVEWTQPVPEVCIIVVEHFEMKPSNEMVVKQEGEDNS